MFASNCKNSFSSGVINGTLFCEVLIGFKGIISAFSIANDFVRSVILKMLIKML
jgi:hypothetical protein